MTTTPDQIARALKPCPFCGSPGEMIHPMGHWRPGGYGPNGSRIRCSNIDCSCCGIACYGDDQDAKAITAWNTRATLTQPTDPNDGREAQPVPVREALSELLSELETSFVFLSWSEGHARMIDQIDSDVVELARAALAVTPAPVEPTEAEAREVLAWDWLDDEFGGDGAVEDRDYSADEMVSAFVAGRCRAPLAFASTRPAAAVEREALIFEAIETFRAEQEDLMRRTLNRNVGEMASIKASAAGQIKDAILAAIHQGEK